ncbi:MAG: phenylalanine--tRNA ligase subunit beta [archaeon]
MVKGKQVSGGILMPSIDVNLQDLQMLVGKKFSVEQLEELLLSVKGELDGFEKETQTLKVDVKDTNRPDLWSTEGIARQLKSYLGIKKGLQNFKVKKSSITLNVMPSVKKVRPLIAAAIVRNVKITEELLVQLIQLQEKVAMGYGKKREQAAIGLYDLSKIKPPITYLGVNPKKTKFIPLEFSNELFLDEILELHPKGQAFGHLIKDSKVFPLVIDSKKNVLSMPPIINSNNSGKVLPGTKVDLFVEVTGFKREFVDTVLQVMVAALSDRGGRIESVKIVDGNKSFYTPNFTPKKISLTLKEINKVSGLNLNKSETLKLCLKAGFKASFTGEKLTVFYPAFRQDVLHAVDIIEDLIIASDYNKIEPVIPKIPTIGKELPLQHYLQKVRLGCVGLGLQEILLFNLTSKELQAKKMLLKDDSFVEISNPVSINYNVFRKSLIPSLLEFLSKNKHHSLPQNIFEIGKGHFIKSSKDNKVEEKTFLTILLTNTVISFNDIKSVFQSLAENLDWKFNLTSGKHVSFIEGRVAEIKIGNKKGILGEIHPNVLENFSLDTPVACLEIEL